MNAEGIYIYKLKCKLEIALTGFNQLGKNCFVDSVERIKYRKYLLSSSVKYEIFPKD